MQGLRVISKTGQALTSEEIDAAHRVANTHGEMNVGTIFQIDPVNGVEVEYHSFKRLAIVQSDISAYFGYDSEVVMRCFCRDIVLSETQAGFVVLNIFDTSSESGLNTRDYEIIVNGVTILSGSGTTQTIIGETSVTTIFTNWPFGGGVGSDGLWNGGISNGTSISAFGGDLIESNVITTPWPSYTLLKQEANAENNFRSAVFLTDGTELASVIRIQENLGFSSQTQIDGNTFLNLSWNGGSYAPVFDDIVPPLGSGLGEFFERKPNLTFHVPEDACYVKREAPNIIGENVFVTYSAANPIPNARVLVGSTEISFPVNFFQTSRAVFEEQQLFGSVSYTLGAFVEEGITNGINYQYYFSYTAIYTDFAIGYYIYSGTYYQETTLAGGTGKVIDNRIKTLNPMYSPELSSWVQEWYAAQAVALEREYARRKKCSDAMYTYLENGFLPPEFEFFIKNTAPKSDLVKRKFPMEIVSGPTYQVTNNSGSEFPVTTDYLGSVTLRYITVDDNGDEIAHQETFEGTARVVEHQATNPFGEAIPTARYKVLSYVNFPALETGFNSDDGSIYYPATSALGNVPSQFMFSNYIEYQHALISLDKHKHLPYANSMFSIINGEMIASQYWNPTQDQLFNGSSTNAVYDPKIISPMSFATLEYSHPQFLFDYIDASRPVEVSEDEELSTDWLSSRLIDDEKITVIPLSFVNENGEDRGLYPIIKYPLDVGDEVPAKLKITGYAETKFDYKTASFSSPVWTEFPVPQFIEYHPIWGNKNCICIGNKNPWSDTKQAAKEQKENISDTPPDEYELTPEEKLYHEVRVAILNGKNSNNA